jgi:hypothetical protein
MIPAIFVSYPNPKFKRFQKEYPTIYVTKKNITAESFKKDAAVEMDELVKFVWPLNKPLINSLF